MRMRRLPFALAVCGLAALAVPETRSLRAEDPLPPALRDVCRAPSLTQSSLLVARTETQPFTADVIPAGDAASGMPPLFMDLGNLHVPVSTSSPEAQAYFDQGMRLAFAFNHAEALRAFVAAQGFDPDCAMCFWGESLVLGPNINAPMFPEAIAPAHAAAQRASALAGNTSEREKALIAALLQRYSVDANVDRALLDTAWADAMARVAAAFPDDDTIQVLYAESLMDLSPWDYWEAEGVKPRGRAADMLAALEKVLARSPDHPGAIHLYIHAVEASSDPERALPHARRLAVLMPGAGHIVHMPAHIYYRVGLYRESLNANIDAVAADERYFARSDSDPFYRNGYYPHNLHFLMASAQMGGDAPTALETASKLDASIDPDVVRVAAALQPVKASPYFAHAQFSTPETILALPDPGDEFVLLKAMWHYARAVASSAAGDTDAAAREIAALSAMEAAADFEPLKAWGVPGREVVQTARLVASGRLADASGKLREAVAAYREAVAIQDRLAYMEPPYWYYPVRQSLGAALLRLGELDAAREAFEQSLERTPNNGWALFGLQQVARQRGDMDMVGELNRQLDRAWFGDRAHLDLARL